jgi:hypothetical protein
MPTFDLGPFTNGGLNTDISPLNLQPNEFNNGENFRIFNGNIESVNEYSTLTTPTNFYGAKLLAVNTSSGNFLLSMGRTKVEVYNGTAWTDISSTAGYTSISSGYETNWQGCLLGNIPIINNYQVYPEYWSPQQISQVLQPLNFDPENTWSEKSYHAKVFRAHGTYLFALNLTESATEYPDSFRWSHPADINGLPFTWDETDLSAIAGKSSIGGDCGAIIDGMSLHDNFVIYSENAVNVLSPSGDEFIWHKTYIDKISGLAGKDCVVNVRGNHFFLTNDDIMSFDGFNIKSIASNRILKGLRNNINLQYANTSYVTRYDRYNEVWFCVPEGSAILPNKAYVYNYADNAWSKRDISGSHIIQGYKISALQTWDSGSADTWDNWSESWDYSSVKNTVLYGMDNSSSALSIVDGGTTYKNILLERTDINFNNIVDFNTITDLYPKFYNSNGNIVYTPGKQEYPNSPISWGDSIVFDTVNDRKIDYISTGCLHSYRMETVDNNKIVFNGGLFIYENDGVR